MCKRGFDFLYAFTVSKVYSTSSYGNYIEKPSFSQLRLWGLVEMTCGLVHTSYSLPEWQAVKLAFFAACQLFHD